MCESNSAQSLSLVEVPNCHSPLHSFVPGYDQVHGYIAPHNPCNGLQSCGSNFCFLSGQPLSHMECGQLWLLALAVDETLFCFKKQGSSRRRENEIESRGYGRAKDPEAMGAGSEGPLQVMSSLRAEFTHGYEPRDCGLQVYRPSMQGQGWCQL